jgi:hypothetical protein
MKQTARKMFAAVIISIVCALACAQAGTLPRTAKIIPPETVLLVDVDNFSQLMTQFEKTSPYKLYKDPAMGAFVESAKTKLQEKVQGFDENDIFRMFFNASQLPQGRAAIALVLNEQAKDANEPPLVIITEWGAKIDKIKEAVKKMLEKNVELGGHQKRSENYRGVTIGIAVDEDATPFNHCFIEDSFIVSTNIDLLKSVIAHIKGASSPTLADDGDYTATIKATGPYHDIDLYVNIKQLINMARSEDTTGKARTTITNLGLDNVASFGCSVGLSRSPGSSCSGKAFLKIDGAKKGICKMLDVKSATIRPPRFIPTSACSAMFVNLNIKKAYDELANILRSISPQAAAVMYMPLIPASPQGEPDVQLKRDIIDHFGSQIVVAQSINKPFSAQTSPTETFVAFAVNNAKALEKSLSVLHSKLLAPNNPDARRELLGHTIYVISLPGLNLFPGARTPMQGPTTPTVPQMPTFAFTITDTHLIFGRDPTVERAIRALSATGDTSIGSAKWFTAAKSAIPSVVGLANLEDNAASSELFWWLLKHGKKALWGPNINGDAGSPSVNFGPMEADELFDPGLLPEFDTVRKYFGLIASYGISRPDGFFFEFKYLNPTGTD